jgi:hypothetical protein
MPFPFEGVNEASEVAKWAAINPKSEIKMVQMLQDVGAEMVQKIEAIPKAVW